MQQPSAGWSVALAAALLFLTVANPASANRQGSTSACDPSTQVACRNHPNICIELERVQDGVSDCPDSSDEDCQPWEFTCLCGQPRCIHSALIGNGVLDCADGSDEGLIGGHCNYDDNLQNIDDLIRYRRASDFRVEVNEGQTTTFFLKTETAQGRRPLGLITSTKGTFVNEETTTQYATQIIGTSIDGTYAKIQSTQSRVFSLVPTEDGADKELLPTGLVSSSIVTRIRGEVTTIETTQFVRTFVDDEYAQEVLINSEIFAPLTDDESGQVNPSVTQQVIPTFVIDSSLMSPDESGKILFKTSHLTSIVGERVIEPSILSSGSNSEEDTSKTEDDKKIISTFNEEVAVDNTLRESRAKKLDADSDSVDPSSSKPNAVALETIVADTSASATPEVADTPASPISEVADSPATLDETEAAKQADSTESSVPTDPVESSTDAPLVAEPVESDASDVKPLPPPAVVEAVEDPAATENILLSATDAPEVDSTEANTDSSISDELAITPDPIRAGRVETVGSVGPVGRPVVRTNRPISVRGSLQLKPTALTRSALQPTGLLSTFEGSLVSDGTTTVYTSSVFGTFIDGEYANVVSSTSSLILPSSVISPSASAVEVVATAVPETPISMEVVPVLQAEPELESSLGTPTEAANVLPGMLSVTRLTTFTFFTTFFMTKDESVITSIVTREVVSSEVQLVEETAMDTIKPVMDAAIKSSNETGDALVSTVFTTYTYFTTFFDDRTTKLLSREEVVSNLVTLTEGQQLTPTSVLAREDGQETTKSPPDVAEGDRIQPSVIESSLMGTGSEEVTGGKRQQLFNSLANGIIKTFFTTFTFFTTALVNGSTVVSSRIVVSSSAVTPTVQLTDIDEDLWESLKAQDDKIRNASSTSSVGLATTTLSPTAPLESEETTTTVVPIIVDETNATQSPETSDVVVEATSQAPDSSTSPLPAVTEEETGSSTDIIPTPPAVMMDKEVMEESPAVSETPTEAPGEIDPSTVTDPSLPNTFYTTFTYFTTFFTEGTSNIVSREETITNVMTDSDVVAEVTMMAPIPPVFPVTFYTTYTYRTTSVIEGETVVSTREETVSNVVTPTVSDETGSTIEPTAPIAAIEITPTPIIDPGLVTHYTTFTYFTTSIEEDSTIVSSSLETITSIASIEPTATTPTETTNAARNIGNNQDVGQLLVDDVTDEGGKIVNQRTGLLTTMRSTQVNDGLTTLFTTDVLGTFINGQYARILESSSEVLAPGRAPTIIIAASGVEGVESTDLSAVNGATQTDLEGSIQQSAESDEEGNKGRVTSRLSGPLRSRTFTPSIRPFTQRARPPLAIAKKPRPAFTSGAAGSDENAPSTSASFPVSASGSVSSTNRFSSSRFRPSISSGGVVSTSNTVDGSSRSQFFRIRGSSQASTSINPTPVASSISSSRTFGAGLSSIGSPRRPSTLQAGNLRPALSTSRFSRPTPSTPVEEEGLGTEDPVEAPVTTAPKPAFSPRRPTPARLSVPVESSTPAPVTGAPSRRNFPFSRGSPRPQGNIESSTSSSGVESKDGEAPSTGRPRFVRPPKVTFTEKPRPIARLPTRPGTRKTPQDAEPQDADIETAPSSVAEEVTLERSKRQSNFEYYFYDPVHYRRPSRQQSSRSRTRTNSRVVDDYDYDSKVSSWDDVDYADEEVVAVTKRPSSFRPPTKKPSASSRATTAKPRTRTSGSSTRQQSGITRMRKPLPEEVGTGKKSQAVSPRRGEVASNTRQRAKIPAAKTPAATPTTERSSTGRRFGNSRKPTSRNRIPVDEEVDDIDAEVVGSAPLLSAPVHVTHKVPTEATIPVVNNGKTEFKTVITASPSVEVLTQYLTAKVSGTWRYYASEISSTPSPGVTVVTQYVLKPTETSTVTFTPTTIRGRPTSYSHVVPSTVYEIEPIVSTISDPVASTNSLLQQLLLGGLQQAGGAPVTSFVTHTSTYVTTLTDHKTTKIPITLRGQEIFTTIIGSSTSVLTVTELSTQTIVTGGQSTEAVGNPLMNLLPALLGNPLLAGQLLQPQLQPSPVLPILATQAPPAVTQPPQKFEEILELEPEQEHQQEPQHEPQQQEIQQQEIQQQEIQQQEEQVPVVIEPAKPVPQTSVITLFLSGRRPGEFSSILSTITLDNADSTVVKRQTSPSDVAEILKMEASDLPFMVGTDKGLYELPETYSSEDLSYYVMSAINEIGAEAITNTRETQRLESIVSKVNKGKPGKIRKAREAIDDIPEEEEILEAIESTVDEVVVDPSTGRQVGQPRKVVKVTKTLSDGKQVVENESGSPNKARKVLVATRRRSQSAELAGAEEQFIRPDESKIPSIASSLEEPDNRQPFLNGRGLGDVYAPRTYYTVYSYFYTLLNGPNSGLVSSRLVSISEVVRGSDGRIPSGFQRTESNNGIYELSSGKSIADLSTRVNSGITTQVNLASMTLVKYGRGSVRASAEKKAEEPIVARPAAVMRSSSKQNIAPTPRVEPSFDAFEREEETVVVPTQSLSSRLRNSATRKQVAVEVKTTKAKGTNNRSRGTIRFDVASVLGDQLSDIPTSVLGTTKRVASTAVRNSIVRSRPQVQQQLIEEEYFDDEEEDFSNDFVDDYYDEPHHEDEITAADYDHEDQQQAKKESKEKVELKGTAVPVKPVLVPVTNPSATTATPTKLIGVTPTRSTISRKLLNPLESHLSSILAHSRSSLKASSSATSTVNDPSFSASSVSRLPSRNSGVTTFLTSTVVLKTFETLSTLAVDGGRSGIPITLVTSTLTTLYDSELSLLTLSPDLFKPVVEPTQLPVSRPNWLNLNPTARLTLPIRASVAIGNGLLPSTESIESTIEDTSTETNTEPSSIEDLLFRAGGSENGFITVVETELRTFTAVVTRKNGNEVEEVTTRLEVLPELVTKTFVQPSPVLDVEGSIEADENLVPQARAIPPREGREQALSEEDSRLARLEISTNSRNQNFATRVMSNGVEVIVAGEKKPSLLAQNVIQHSQTVIEPSPPITLAASTISNQVRVASDVDNVQLFSSIQSDPAQFWTQTQMTTFTYLTTLVEGDSKVVSSREEVITNLVTQESGHRATVTTPSVTLLTSGAPGSSNYNTLTHMTTYTYFNTFMDLKRPVVITSKEIVSNVVTVPAGQPVPTEKSFETSTYLRTYVFSSKLDRDALATSKEVVTQIVVTEAPALTVKPTPVVTFSEVTKTYLTTVTLTTTEVDGTDSLVRRITTVKPEVVVETIRDFEPTPVLEGSQILFTEDDFGFGEVPAIVATKTYFTTMTHFTTVLQGSKTIVQSRKEVKSSVVTETLDGFASLFAEPATSAVQDSKPTYVQLGPNLYGKLRTLFATATYFITNSAGEVTSKRLVVPQVTTETVPLALIPSEALIEPSIPVLPDIETTPVPTSSQILNAEQLNSLKQSFLAGSASTTAGTNPSSILTAEQLNSLKESFLANRPSTVPTDLTNPPVSTDGSTSDSTTDTTTDDSGLTPPDISLSPPDISLSPPEETGATVIMVTNTAGEVLIVPTDLLNVEPTSTSSDSSSSSPSSSSSSSSSGISGGTLASILGGLGTLGLTALGQSMANNNPGGLNINLGPMFDAMTGVLSNGLIAARRNSTERSDSQSGITTSLESPLNQFNNPPFPSQAPRLPSVDPLFIPIGGLAGAEPSREVIGRRPPSPQTFIPLRPQGNGQQRPPTVVRRPEPGVPLQPGVPGSPLLRPGAQQPQFSNLQVIPGQQGQPIRVSFPPLQTGFTGMTNQPVGPTATRINAGSPANIRPPPPPFINGQNNIDRAEIQPSRPLQPARGSSTTSQLFAANGQPINAPPLPPASPPPPPPGPVPQLPVQAIRPDGTIVPGPDGKPVRIVPVPEGQEPPPGAGGQVFIRPVLETPFVPMTNVRPVDAVPSRRDEIPNIQFPGVRATVPQFQLPAIQTIASVEGENKIVRTNIINGDQTIVIEPNDPTPILSPPSIRPSLIGGETVRPTETPEDGGAIEVVGNILKPGLAPSSSSVEPSIPAAVESATTSGVTPSREFTFESESGEVVHTPNLDLFLNSPSTEIIPSVFEMNIPSEVPSEVPSLPQEEPFGVTSVLMGPGQVFTTIVSRIEPDGRTALSTIIDQATEVNYIETPSTVVPFVPSISTNVGEIEEERVPEVITFPADSPFNPPTKAPTSFRPSTSEEPSTFSVVPVSSTEKEPPAVKEVVEDNKDHKVVFGGGFGGIFGVNQPSSILDGCNGQCNKEKLEICIYANGQHQCQCRPGHSRHDSSDACSKTYTYQLKLVLERVNDTMLHYDDTLRNEISPQYRSLASRARTGLKQALMKTDLSNSVQDSQVMGMHPTSESELQNDGVLVDFFVHLKEKQDERDLKHKLMKSLEGTNFVLGDSEITASRFTESLTAEDFDECSHEGHHDCSEFADCINEKGTYRCQCRPGFVDSSDESGRICLAERQDCEECNGNGRCVFDPSNNEMECICNRWFAGKECHINLKVVMIVVLAVGIFLILLITAIVVVCCLRSKRAKGSISGGPSFLRYRGPSVPASGTLDRAAMIRGDTSSESSGNENFAGSNTLDGKSRNAPSAAAPAALQSYRPYGETLMIPRAKHQHGPAGGNPGAAERGESSGNREHQLLDYLDGRPGAKKVFPDREPKDGRSTEALSAGGRTSVSSASQFRESLENVESGLPDNQEKSDQPDAMTVSEVRSFDETTIHPATRRPAKYYHEDSEDNSNFDSL